MKPTEENLFADIEVVYKYAVNDLRIDPKTLILYGRSLGTTSP